MARLVVLLAVVVGVVAMHHVAAHHGVGDPVHVVAGYTHDAEPAAGPTVVVLDSGAASGAPVVLEPPAPTPAVVAGVCAALLPAVTLLAGPGLLADREDFPPPAGPGVVAFASAGRAGPPRPASARLADLSLLRI